MLELKEYMQRQQKLIFFGAHPDDESFGVGGTLAKYAAQGVNVVYACATRGEVGSVDPQFLGTFATIGDLRWAELVKAAQVLQLANVIHLGYRDSGMPGQPENHHPQALAAAPIEEVTARAVKVIREQKPQVVVTFDPIGGYRHPDHVAIHNATVRAFTAAGDPAWFPELGPAFQPQKLYFSVFPKGLLKLAVKALPLFGQDPHRFGQNRDIDLASLAEVEFPIHARIRIGGEMMERKQRAAACHQSQLSSGPPSSGLAGWFYRKLSTQETFMRAYPLVNGRLRETDLFEGVV
ncbi:MAG: PIG-L deacetylase family protein [Bellilinea sp.]